VADHDFSKSIAPLKEKASDKTDPIEDLESPVSTLRTQEEEEESDKLHKEIVKSLSPKPSHTAPPKNALSPDQLDEQSMSNQARISSYLPSEYDNYWATTAEDVPPAPLVTAPAQKEAEPLNREVPTITTGDHQLAGPEAVVIAPLSPRKAE
jgi:hypothetical protein